MYDFSIVLYVKNCLSGLFHFFLLLPAVPRTATGIKSTHRRSSIHFFKQQPRRGVYQFGHRPPLGVSACASHVIAWSTLHEHNNTSRRFHPLTPNICRGPAGAGEQTLRRKQEVQSMCGEAAKLGGVTEEATDALKSSAITSRPRSTLE